MTHLQGLYEVNPIETRVYPGLVQIWYSIHDELVQYIE